MIVFDIATFSGKARHAHLPGRASEGRVPTGTLQLRLIIIAIIIIPLPERNVAISGADSESEFAG